MAIKHPPRLENGDTVAVVATARVVDRKAVEAGIEILRGWQLNVVTGSALYRHHHLFAGSDQERYHDFQQALNDPEVKAIICARGGYGTTRILDKLDWEGFKRHPKWVCGFSDVTSLLCHIHSLGFACIHSSMPQLFNEETVQDYNSLKKALFGTAKGLKAAPFSENQYGVAEGHLLGGNLSLLVHLMGTSSEINTDGKILLLEEVDEYLYHLDRMMVQLSRSGKLDRLAGVAVGHLTKMKEGDLKFGTDAMGLLKSHLHHLKIPVGFGFPFGHQKPNLAVPIGIMGVLDVNDSGSKLELKY
jgi:muramoyltetrapeptide carboxypeptidase